MPNRILLLTGEIEAPHLSGLLTRANPELEVTWTPSAEALAAAVNGDVAGIRLIAMLTDVIVPPAILSALPGPSYNFHPGPPTYPGSHAAGFAIYDGAETFGVTLHEMAAAVDSGPIVAVRRFPIPPETKFADLEITAFTALMELFRDYATPLACDDTPLPLSDDRWAGRTRTKAEAARLSEVEADLSEEEIVRRYRAFG